MPGTCEDPVNTAVATVSTTAQQAQSTVETVSLPKVDLSSIGLFPVWAGWIVLSVFGLLLILFVIAYLFKNSIAITYWSYFIWTSLLILLIALSAINGTFNSVLLTKNICSSSKDPTITIILSILSAITLLMGYIINFDFGQRLDVQTYLLIMLHVNLLSSLLVLSFVVLFKLAATTK
jgi:hypothetical protein